MKFSKKVFLLFIITFFLGCSAGFQFNSGKKHEKKGNHVKAVVKYEKVYTKNPDHPKTPEALYRMAKIYQSKLKIYSYAEKYYKIILEKYEGKEPWFSLAKLGIFNSPNYFPIAHKNLWVEGDSDTKGKNMRSKWTCVRISTGVYCVKKRITAGSKYVTTVKRYFIKDKLEMREYLKPNTVKSTIILSFPFEKGRTWESVRDGRKIKYVVENTNVAVNVVAGEFQNCIKVSEQDMKYKGAKKYNYYAPGVGWVLTTTGSGKREFKDSGSELLSYKVKPETEELIPANYKR